MRTADDDMALPDPPSPPNMDLEVEAAVHGNRVKDNARFANFL